MHVCMHTHIYMNITYMIKRQINRSFIFVDSYFGMNNNFRNILSVKKGIFFFKIP